MAKLSTYASATPAAGDKLAGVDVSASATRVFLVSALAAYVAAANCQIGLAAARPAAGTDGRLYYATDTETLSRDNGSTWDDLTTGGGGAGTITEVNGQTGPVVTLTAADVGADATGTAAAAIATHEAASDPHPQYMTSAETAAAYQPLDSDLTAIAALSTTAFGRSLLEAATAAALRTLAGLGTAATADTGTTGSQVLTRTGADTLYQPLDSDLTAIAALTTTSYGRDLLTAANSNDLQTKGGLLIGLDVQAYSGELAALAGLISAANKLPYFTGAGTAALADLTAAGRALLDDADAAAQRTTLGLGTAATTASTDYAAASHTHAAGDVTSGQLALARGGTAADLSATGGAGQVLKQTSAGGAVTVAALSASELPAHAHTGSTTGGTLTTGAIQMSAAGLVGRSSSGAAQEITVGSGLDLTGTTLTATGGGGAPADAYYITTAYDATLSNEKAIPAWASHPDIAPASANALDDEFPGSSLDAKWTWFNQSTATATVANSTLQLAVPASTTNIRGITQSLPSGATTVAAKVQMYFNTALSGTNNCAAGLARRESSSGKLEIIWMVWQASSTRTGIYCQRYTNSTTFSATVGGEYPLGNVTSPQMYFRFVDDNTNVSPQYSFDGNTWFTVTTFARGAFLTADQIGLVVLNQFSTTGCGLIADWFRRTA